MAQELSQLLWLKQVDNLNDLEQSIIKKFVVIDCIIIIALVIIGIVSCTI